jgi:hypothetical protein
MDETNRDVLLSRIDALERRALQLKVLNFFSLAGVMALVVVTIATSRPKATLEVQNLLLKDQWGNTRAQLGVGHDGSPHLTFFDQAKNKLVSLAQTYADSSALTFFDRNDPRILLSSNSKGLATLRFLDEARESQTSVFMGRDGSMGVSLVSEDEGMFLGFHSDGSPVLRIVDDTGKERGRISLSADDFARIGALYETAKPPKVSTTTLPNRASPGYLSKDRPALSYEAGTGSVPRASGSKMFAP